MIIDLPPEPVTWTCPLTSRASSPAAHYIANEFGKNWRPLHRSYSLGIGGTGVLEQLCDVHDQCSAPGWDGYDAVPVTREAYVNAYRFIESLPLEFPTPTVSAEPDGHITFEWYSSPRRTLSVSISPEGEIHYAALIGAKKSYGTEPFSGEIPQDILGLALRVAAA